VYKRKTASGVLLASMLILVSACVGKVQPTQAEDPVQAASDAKNSMDYLAAINLINTLVQVPRLHPESAADPASIEPNDRIFAQYRAIPVPI